ncbi:leishmanolysin family protein, putative [Ichthyophthirius multifiliis]|uniref:Leishmanolysin family protein, putative n=1 Tax=Ichthyophthirius multifiliis TaxID=5932 RepID=G0QWH0_ICHMU|nr:leishmanolysin family protein, putative [Ichthyophthirius multifiliis]EGR30431.1 leishmanolysin family protein, putative [Ichthyophthirius multifiliis]|eukprot:XP_004032018.1 leishmanolysin family protein, putative [Ichthyophthirius multifiliis]
METAKIYFQKLLKVNPFLGNNYFPRYSKLWKQSCNGVFIPDSAIEVGIPDSDLHIYVITKNKPQDGDLANACVCAYNDMYMRPSFGRIQFDLGLFGKNQDAESFENDLETTIHEILHILGFSGFQMQFWINPQTGQYYGQYGLSQITKIVIYRGLPTTLVMTKNILQTARKYYACPNMEGMQLENEGGSGSLGSHWEQLIVQNEMMMASDVITDAQLSVLTIALLRDTGYYTEVNENMADNLYWGKGKGCSFVIEGCYSKQKFDEFPQEMKVQCSFENDGYGFPETTPYFDKCLMKDIYGNKLCTSFKNNFQFNNSDIALEYFGISSKCFNSTSSNNVKLLNDEQARCHMFKCSPDHKSISIFFPQIKRQIICTKEKEEKLINPQNDRFGKIVCPSSFLQFCDYVHICPNYCSSVGFCVRGVCLCLPGWGGVDCSVKCHQVVSDKTCVKQCPGNQVISPDRSCQNQCPNGYFRHGPKCFQCHPSCKRCKGGTANDCTLCQFLTQPNQYGQCISIY